MIELTRITGDTFWINPDTIQFVEHCGDTIVTLITGEKVLVRESVEVVQGRFIDFKKQLGRGPSSVAPHGAAHVYVGLQANGTVE